MENFLLSNPQLFVTFACDLSQLIILKRLSKKASPHSERLMFHRGASTHSCRLLYLISQKHLKFSPLFEFHFPYILFCSVIFSPKKMICNHYIRESILSSINKSIINFPMMTTHYRLPLLNSLAFNLTNIPVERGYKLINQLNINLKLINI